MRTRTALSRSFFRFGLFLLYGVELPSLRLENFRIVAPGASPQHPSPECDKNGSGSAQMRKGGDFAGLGFSWWHHSRGALGKVCARLPLNLLAW